VHPLQRIEGQGWSAWRFHRPQRNEGHGARYAESVRCSSPVGVPRALRGAAGQRQSRSVAAGSAKEDIARAGALIPFLLPEWRLRRRPGVCTSRYPATQARRTEDARRARRLPARVGRARTERSNQGMYGVRLRGEARSRLRRAEVACAKHRVPASRVAKNVQNVPQY